MHVQSHVANLESILAVTDVEPAILKVRERHLEGTGAFARIQVDIEPKFSEALSSVGIYVVVNGLVHECGGDSELGVVSRGVPLVRESTCSALGHTQALLKEVENPGEMHVLGGRAGLLSGSHGRRVASAEMVIRMGFEMTRSREL